MDIKQFELEGLPAWLESGALDNVQQIGLEFHLNHGDIVKKTKKFMGVLRDLYFQGNIGLMLYEVNGC